MQLKLISLGLTVASLMVYANAKDLVDISNNKVSAGNIGNNLLRGTSLSNILNDLQLDILRKRGLNRPEMVARAVYGLNKNGDAPKATNGKNISWAVYFTVTRGSNEYIFIFNDDEQEEASEAADKPLFGDDFSGESIEEEGVARRSLLGEEDGISCGDDGEGDSKDEFERRNI